MRLKGLVSLITGGGRGIGRAVALAFAEEGASVIVTARSLSQIDGVRDEIRARGGEALSIPADLASEEQIVAVIREIIEKFGRIDVLVNNGGITGPISQVSTMALDTWNETLRINLTGTMLCSREAAKHMMLQKSGTIIMVSSEGGRGGDGRAGRPSRSAYDCSKAGMIALTEALAVELGPYGIRVNALSPGGVRGDRLQRLIASHIGSTGASEEDVLKPVLKNFSLGRFAEESEVAAVAVFLASRDASAITGQVLPVNCGQHV
jgi:NAD(P)-dependent dehydrogenase (short-subunit alcohol dehydrogenase family)